MFAKDHQAEDNLRGRGAGVLRWVGGGAGVLRWVGGCFLHPWQDLAVRDSNLPVISISYSFSFLFNFKLFRADLRRQ